jgi:hypothetical protein
LPCWTRRCGLSVRNTPSSRGSQARTKDCINPCQQRPTMQVEPRNENLECKDERRGVLRGLQSRIWNRPQTREGVRGASTSDLLDDGIIVFKRGKFSSVCKTRRNRTPFNVHFWPFSRGPTGIGEPDSMNPARNNPSLLPLFAIMCNDTDMAPADSPQLK